MEKLSHSKQRLLDALAYFLTYESVEDIKVSELIRKAQVSRSTFYRSFETKGGFFQWVLDYHMEVLSSAAKYTANTPTEFYEHYFNYLYGHAIYFKTFNNSSMWPEFHYRMTQIGIDVYQTFIYRKIQDKQVSRLISHYVINAHIGTATAWLNEKNLQSPNEVAKTVATMTREALASQRINLSEIFPYQK